METNKIYCFIMNSGDIYTFSSNDFILKLRSTCEYLIDGKIEMVVDKHDDLVEVIYVKDIAEVCIIYCDTHGIRNMSLFAKSDKIKLRKFATDDEIMKYVEYRASVAKKRIS